MTFFLVFIVPGVIIAMKLTCLIDKVIKIATTRVALKRKRRKLKKCMDLRRRRAPLIARAFRRPPN